jgi:hypothetical protein
MDGTRVRPVKGKKKNSERKRKRGMAAIRRLSPFFKRTSRVQGKEEEEKSLLSLHSNGLTLKVEGKRSREKDSHRRWVGKA